MSIDLRRINVELLSSKKLPVRVVGEVLQMWRQASVGMYAFSDNELMIRELREEKNQAIRIRALTTHPTRQE